VFLCAACGGMSSLLGILFLAVYFMLRSYTSSLVYFETVPTYVPASMVRSRCNDLVESSFCHNVVDWIILQPL
jgi:hypothetical protein